ncbi:Hypothetical predicted protein [Paramuricea clavata]|uniref:Uncharacterized protein n=1 Tax=Paramuricea clavata TaxID=317549 RepID=A0A6S7FVX5_PARCT|nr:Hypothetical predicted protein [Paramuricea clavata]
MGSVLEDHASMMTTRINNIVTSRKGKTESICTENVTANYFSNGFVGVLCGDADSSIRQPETNVKNAPTRKNGTSFQQMNTGLQSRKMQNREEVQQRHTRPENQQRGRSYQQDRPRKFSRIRDKLNARKPTYAEAARSPYNCRSERKRQATTTIDYNQRQPKHFLGSTHRGNYPPTNNRQLVRNHQQNQRHEQ